MTGYGPQAGWHRGGVHPVAAADFEDFGGNQPWAFESITQSGNSFFANPGVHVVWSPGDPELLNAYMVVEARAVYTNPYTNSDIVGPWVANSYYFS